MKILITGLYPEQLQKLCQDAELDITDRLSRDDGIPTIVLHNICGCCDLEENLSGNVTRIDTRRDVHLFVTTRAESSTHYPWAIRIMSKVELLALIHENAR